MKQSRFTDSRIISILKQAEAGTPLRILQAALLAAHAAVRPLGDHWLGAAAAHEGELTVHGKEFFRIRLVHPGERYDGVRHAMLRISPR